MYKVPNHSQVSTEISCSVYCPPVADRSAGLGLNCDLAVNQKLSLNSMYENKSQKKDSNRGFTCSWFHENGSFSVLYFNKQ